MSNIKIDTDKMRSVSLKMETCKNVSTSAGKDALAAFYLLEYAVNTDSLNNLNSKLISIARKMGELTEKLARSAVLLEMVADNFESGDGNLLKDTDLLSKRIDEVIEERKERTTYIGEWSSNATDSEFALLSSIWNSASTHEDSIDEFFRQLTIRLPKNSPLWRFKREYVMEKKTLSGMEALILTDDRGHATVIFSGTNGLNDLIEDNKLAFGYPTAQEDDAKELIDYLSKSYRNITVTGHSLGGYLSTYVTLKNKYVSKCVTFDPPGRGGLLGFLNTDDHTEKRITTYVGAGVVNKVGRQWGTVKSVDIPWSFTDDYGFPAIDKMMNHNIDDFYEAIGGAESIEKNWSDIESGAKDLKPSARADS